MTTDAQREYNRAYYARRRDELKARQAAYNEANREIRRVKAMDYHARNSARIAANVRAYEAAHPERRKAYNDRYYVENRAGFIERARSRQENLGRATASWADPTLIQQFYDEAARLSVETGEPHEVDHAVPLKHPLVCGLHVQGNLQVLTRAANRAKRNRFAV